MQAECTFDKQVLLEEPFSLKNNTELVVRVVAVNSIGLSVPSLAQTTLLIHTAPSPPVDLKLQETLLFWEPGYDGGSKVLYYTVWHDQGNNIWTSVINTTKPFVRISESGFYKTTASNAIGTSLYSDSLQYTAPSQGLNSTELAIIVAAITGLVVLSVAVAVYLCCRRAQKNLDQVIPDTEITL